MPNTKGMNALRIRVVRLEPNYGVGDKEPFSIQVSQDGLSWWNLARFADEKLAIEVASDITETADVNFTAKASHILWSTRI